MRSHMLTKIYSGGEPDFEEGEVFKLTVPLDQNGDIKNEISQHLSVTGRGDRKIWVPTYFVTVDDWILTKFHHGVMIMIEKMQKHITRSAEDKY